MVEFECFCTKKCIFYVFVYLSFQIFEFVNLALKFAGPLLLNPLVPSCNFQGLQFSSVQFSRSVVSNSLRPHESQHARPPCPSLNPGVHSNSCPSSQWCHPAISSFVTSFSSCPQSLPASGSFPISQLFASGGQSIGVSASASVLPMNTQAWSPLGWTGWISLQSKGLSRVFSNTTVQNINFLALSFFHSPTLTSIHDHWKNHNLDQTDLCWHRSMLIKLSFLLVPRLVM